MATYLGHELLWGVLSLLLEQPVHILLDVAALVRDCLVGGGRCATVLPFLIVRNRFLSFLRHLVEFARMHDQLLLIVERDSFLLVN